MSDVDQRVSELLLRFKADKQSAAQAKAEVDSVAKSFDKITDANEEVNRAIEATKKQIRSLDDVAETLNKSFSEGLRSEAIDKVTQAYAELNHEVGLTNDDVADLAKALQDVGATDDEIKRVAQSVQGARGGGDSGGGGSTSGAFRTGAQLASTLGAGQIAEPIRAIGEVSRLTDQFGGTIGALATPLTAVIALVAAVGVAFKLVDEQLKGVREQLTGALAAQNNYYQSLGKTTDQIKAEIQQRQQQQQALQQQIQETQGGIDSAFNQAVSAFSDPVARVLDAAGKLPTAQLRDQLEQLNAQFTANGDTIARLQQGLDAGTYATNTAAEAEKALADARTKTALASADAAKSSFLEDQTLLRGNVDNVNSALQKYSDQLGANAEAISALIASGDTSADTQAKIKELVDANTEAEKRRADILENVLPVVQANAQAEEQRAAAERTRASLEQQLQQSGQAYLQAQSALDKATQQYAAGAQKAADTLSAAFDKAEADRQAAEDKANADADQARLNAADQRNQAIANAEDKAAEDRLKAKEDYEEKVKQIERQFQFDATNAVRSRDAVAFTNAKETRDKDLKSAKSSYDKQLKDINRALKQQEKQIQQSYQAQLKTIQQNLDKQLKAAQDSYNKQVQTAQTAYNQQLTDLQNNLTQAQNLRDAAYTTEQTALQSFTDFILSQAGRLTQATTSTSTASAGATNISNGVNTATGTTSSFGTSSYSSLTKPTRLSSLSSPAQAGGGIPQITLIVQGNTMRQMKREMNKKFDEFAKGASQQYGYTP